MNMTFVERHTEVQSFKNDNLPKWLFFFVFVDVLYIEFELNRLGKHRKTSPCEGQHKNICPKSNTQQNDNDDDDDVGDDDDRTVQQQLTKLE